jgi:hypothetical protein
MAKRLSNKAARRRRMWSPMIVSKLTPRFPIDDRSNGDAGVQELRRMILKQYVCRICGAAKGQPCTDFWTRTSQGAVHSWRGAKDERAKPKRRRKTATKESGSDHLARTVRHWNTRVAVRNTST